MSHEDDAGPYKVNTLLMIGRINDGTNRKKELTLDVISNLKICN